MVTPYGYIFGTVLGVALLSFIGIVSLVVQEDLLERAVLYLVSFSAGALFGTVFLRMIPKIVTNYGFGPSIGIALLSGIVLSFGVEGYLHWHHHRTGDHETEAFSYIILFSDAVHNFIDGLVIASGFLVSTGLGFATTAAVVLHKIPKEAGDFGALIHGGLSVPRAITYNFLVNVTAFIGAGTAIYLAGNVTGINRFLIAFAAGTFIYVAGSDLLPEVKEEKQFARSTLHLAAFLGGIGVVYLLNTVLLP